MSLVESASLVDAKSALESPLRDEWRELVAAARDINALYASPCWLEHCLATAPLTRRFVATLRDDRRQLVGLSPLSLQPWTLPYEVKNRVLVKRRLSVATIPPGCPIYRPGVAGWAALIQTTLSNLSQCDAIFIPTLPAERLAELKLGTANGLMYVPYGVRPWHQLTVRDSFEVFLASKGRKARYNLRRTVRMAEEENGETLRAERIEREDQVAEFVRVAKQISRQSWQHRRLGSGLDSIGNLEPMALDLAQRGILRSYLLWAGTRPLAFAIGHQYQDVFYFENTGYQESTGQLSPGTVLLYYLIEDLHDYRRPRIVNFGIGDAIYKRRFADIEKSDTAILCFRDNLANRLTRWSHGRFQASVELAKRVLRRQVNK